MSEEDSDEAKYQNLDQWERAELASERQRADKWSARYVEAKSEIVAVGGTLRAQIAALQAELAVAKSDASRASDKVSRLQSELADAKREREFEVHFARGPGGMIISPLKIKAA